ncbi:endo-1,4-beta-xylanase [Crateriforma spongiae]|uniref:endo-1,4-beta-xylanase n=1 Tax=Crateriforma spongiae TaxID=2724528 RepID=UPI00144720DA|nr:endo-1,4-beta-xylanase [Crateriforma spongiae]
MFSWVFRTRLHAWISVLVLFANWPLSVSAQDSALIARQDTFATVVRPNAGSVLRSGGVLKVDSPRDGLDAWAIQLQSPMIGHPIGKGEAFSVCFSARTVSAGNQNSGTIHVTVSKDDPWRAIQANNGFRTLAVPNVWHDFAINFRAEQDFSADQFRASLQLAAHQQQLEIRDLKFRRHGQAPDALLPKQKLFYPGRFADPTWKQLADDRIRRHRQSDLRIRVTDTLGNPVPDCTVTIRQQKHAYTFGTFVGDVPNRNDDAGQRFRRETLHNFNRVTLPRYWADWGTDSPEGLDRSNAVARWAASTDLELKTHLLLYPRYIPERVVADRQNAALFRAQVVTAMEDALDQTRHLKCFVWDAINELRDDELVGDVLGHEFYAEVFKLANRRRPDVRWFINEYGLLTGGAKRQEYLDQYIRTIKQIMADGGAVEGIGVQGHFTESLVTPQQIWEVLDRLDDFGLPIEVTEFDVDTDDVVTQAEFTEDFMTAIFAHPSTTGLTTWGFWEGDMWRPRGAMYRTDWTIKPNGKVWQKLVLDRWWTDETAVTDGTGECVVRVFHGDHTVTVQTKTPERSVARRFTVTADQEAQIVLGEPEPTGQAK